MKEKRILLIEDDRDVSDLIGYILSDDFCHLTMCATVSGGEKEMNKPFPDLLILDIMLPDENGVDLCHQIKAKIRHPLYEGHPDVCPRKNDQFMCGSFYRQAV